MMRPRHIDVRGTCEDCKTDFRAYVTENNVRKDKEGKSWAIFSCPSCNKEFKELVKFW